jgi:hypothetical protein
MTGHVTSRYQGLNSSEVGAKIENLGYDHGHNSVILDFNGPFDEADFILNSHNIIWFY